MIEWLDLSWNAITRIDNDIMCFPCLKTLYLHGNQINSLMEIRKLARLPDLRHIKLYANPIAKAAHYRNYVIGKEIISINV